LQDLVLNELDDNEEIVFGKGFGCITDLEYSSDGYLYVISYLNNGAIYKIHPK
jgi:glucose/arabinose dehydrogenase